MSAATCPVDTATLDRAAGVLVASAAGDALGAGYEFDCEPLPADPADLAMIGGGLGGFAPGEWTDDTDMAYPIAALAATGADLRSVDAQRAVLTGWLDWARSDPADIGILTRAVLGALRDPDPGRCRDVALQHYTRTGQGASNGAVMRTGPVALAHLGDPAATYQAAYDLATMTHADPLAGQAAGLWSVAIEAAVRTATLDLAAALDTVGRDVLSGDARRFWADVIAGAEAGDPADFAPNGFAVTCVQAAWSAICRARSDAGDTAAALEAAVRYAVMAGDDTDTVAAVAGALAGARWGATAVPARWRLALRRRATGPYGRELGASALVRLAVLAVRGGRPDPSGWPVSADLLPYYRGRFELPDVYAAVDLAGVTAPDGAPLRGKLTAGDVSSVGAAVADGCDLVVSCCRMGTDQVPPGKGSHLEVWLTDTNDPAQDPNAGFVLADTGSLIAEQLRRGAHVHLHCVEGKSRTPSVAIVALVALGVPVADATRRVLAALGHHDRSELLLRLVEEITAGR